jgi:hypothetical protein
VTAIEGQVSFAPLQRGGHTGTMIKEMIGTKWGRCTVIVRAADRVSSKGKKCVMYECRCDCGALFVTAGKDLRRGQPSATADPPPTGASPGAACLSREVTPYFQWENSRMAIRTAAGRSR